MKTMYWYNEPVSWSQDSDRLTIQVNLKQITGGKLITVSQ